MRLAAAKYINLDATAAAVLSELVIIFALKQEHWRLFARKKTSLTQDSLSSRVGRVKFSFSFETALQLTTILSSVVPCTGRKP